MVNLGAVGSPSHPLHHADRPRSERIAIPADAGLLPGALTAPNWRGDCAP